MPLRTEGLAPATVERRPTPFWLSAETRTSAKAQEVTPEVPQLPHRRLNGFRRGLWLIVVASFCAHPTCHALLKETHAAGAMSLLRYGQMLFNSFSHPNHSWCHSTSRSISLGPQAPGGCLDIDSCRGRELSCSRSLILDLTSAADLAGHSVQDPRSSTKESDRTI